MSLLPLRHILRVRRSDDFEYMRAGLVDELLINANQLEHCPESTAAAIASSTLPFTIDPVLTRFQMPAWWRTETGQEKTNYRRLGKAYVNGTSIRLPTGPLVDTVTSDDEWRALAKNVLTYQTTRLREIRPQLDLFAPELHPTRLMAPALVAFSSLEDRINRVLAEAAAEDAPSPVALPVIVPLKRLVDEDELQAVLDSVPREGIGSYFLWTPDVTEELLLADHAVLLALLRLVSALAARGVAVGHLHSTYSILALHDAGVGAVTNHLGWIDKGEPAGDRAGGPRSTQTYISGIHHPARADRARALGRDLDADEYIDRYCSCTVCTGAFDAGQHPLDLLLEDQPVAGQARRRTLTSRAATLNGWHYLFTRRREVQAFAAEPAADVLRRDIARAAALAGGEESARLQHLADELRTA